jgi:hypothetical protein
LDKYPTPISTLEKTHYSNFDNATVLKTVTSRGASVFSEIDHKFVKMWKVHDER